jgi:polyferredoxin
MFTGERRMQAIAKVLVYLAMLAFVMAVVCVFAGPIITAPESYSRAAGNLALIAIALFVGFKE